MDARIKRMAEEDRAILALKKAEEAFQDAVHSADSLAGKVVILLWATRIMFVYGRKRRVAAHSAMVRAATWLQAGCCREWE